MATPPRHRTVRFDYPDDLQPGWHSTLPEFACAANAVSLMMPYLEPYVVRAMREALPHLEGDLEVEARAYIAQESQHHAQHRRFNRAIERSVRGVTRLEQVLDATYRWLWRSRSERFHLAYAAAAEAGAYGAARWVERHHAELFRGADSTVASLYLWHLAEEVEHKNVAYDVYDARYGSRWPLAGAMVVSIALLMVFAVAGTTLGLVHERRLFHPVATARLLRWSLGFVFSELPNMFASVLPGHHPSDFSDPTWFGLYLLDVEAGRTPVSPVRGAA
ncbi:MAG: metal-dependent hydrolase [Acidimicrobiales bacterium]